MLIWTEEFATGNEAIDQQHRMLIEKINALEESLKEPLPPKAVYDEILHFLGSYITTHFKFEEQCMEQVHCPAHEVNQRSHAVFMTVFGKFREHYETEGPRPDLLHNLHSAIADWVKSHILAVDTRLRGCFPHPNRPAGNAAEG